MSAFVGTHFSSVMCALVRTGAGTSAGAGAGAEIYCHFAARIVCS